MDLLVALDERKEMVRAHRKLRKSEKYYCPSCKKRVCLKNGSVIQPHFAHFQDQSCHVFSEGETREHLEGKIQLATSLKSMTNSVQLEAYLPELQQRPDILYENDHRKIAIEFQCSAIPIEKIVERTVGYRAAGYEVIWILGNNFPYKKRLTAFQKACLYSSTENNRLLLLHYNVETERFLIRYDFQVNNQGKMLHQLKTVNLDEHQKIQLNPNRKRKLLKSNEINVNQKHEQFMKEIRYPSKKVQEFLELIYQNKENFISIPKELYVNLSSEWIIQQYPMHWKYQFILWVEGHSRKKILTMKMMEKWLVDKVNLEEITYYESPQLLGSEKLKPFIEFLDLLTKRKIVKKMGYSKWSYQQPLKRYHHLEEKFSKEFK